MFKFVIIFKYGSKIQWLTLNFMIVIFQYPKYPNIMWMVSNKDKKIHKPDLAHRFETSNFNFVSMNKIKKKQKLAVLLNMWVIELKKYTSSFLFGDFLLINLGTK